VDARACRETSIDTASAGGARPAGSVPGDEEIYSLERSVECWYRVVSGAARRFALRADGRQTVDLLLPDDFFGFGVRGKHAFTAEALADDTVIARYPVSRMETLAAPTPLQPENWPASSLAECRGCTPCF
jgi:CRP-like cAMP-binding protein